MSNHASQRLQPEPVPLLMRPIVRAFDRLASGALHLEHVATTPGRSAAPNRRITCALICACTNRWHCCCEV